MKRMNLIIASMIVLALMNAVTLWFLFARGEQNNNGPTPSGDGQGPGRYFIEQLKLDPAQQDSFAILRHDHRQAMDQLRKEEKDLHETFYALLKTNDPNSATADSIAGQIAADRKKGLLITLEHFRKLKALCRPDQQQRFNGIIDEIVKNFGPPPPGPQRPQGPPPGEHPPGR